MRYPPSYRFPPGYSFPPGYRFLPTDEEVLTHLKEKIVNPITYKYHLITAEPDFFKSSPDMHFNKYRARGENSCYFFTSRDRKYKNGKRPDRRAGNGFYRASATVKPVHNKNGKKIGSKRSLVYYEGDHKNSVKTNWLLTEYVIDEHRIHINNQTNSMKLDDCVVYKIHYNNKKSKNCQLEQGESSNSQYQGEGGGGHEIETAGCTEDERQIIVIGTDCTEEVQDQGVMVNFVEQAKVETEIGKSVDKGKGVLQEEEDDSDVDQYLINFDHHPGQYMSCPSSSLGYFDNNNGYVSNTVGHMPIRISNGQYGVSYFDGSENGGYDEQLPNMQVHDQLNSLNNNASCSFYLQTAEGDYNQFDGSENGGYDEPQLSYMQVHDQFNSLNNNASCSFYLQTAEGDDNQFDGSENGGYDEQLSNMQVHDQFNSLNNNASCSFYLQTAEGDDNQFDNSLDSQSNGNDIAGYSYDEQLGIMQFNYGQLDSSLFDQL